MFPGVVIIQTTRNLMQNDRHNNQGITVGACVWCRSEYVVGCSRAREQNIFCSKKCEIEARFWLVDVLRDIEKLRQSPEDNSGRRPPA